jgi:hypothetical protein
LEQERLGIAKRVGPAAAEELEKLKIELAKKVDQNTLQKLERLKSNLARRVSPKDLVELEKLKVASVTTTPSMVLDFENLKLETAKLVKSSALVTLEHQRADFRQKVPLDVALEIQLADLKAAEISGGAMLQFIVTTQLESIGRIDHERMRDLAKRHAFFAEKKMSPRRLREVIRQDYKEAELEVQLASRHSSTVRDVVVIARK